MKKRYKIMLLFLAVVVMGLVIPQNLKQPVQGATAADYHPQSFWYYPWGRSGTHKGVDIFANKGTEIHSATRGLVVYTGSMGMGGNVAIILGPKWRLHYYAHMDQISVSEMDLIDQKTQIGTVGDSGNASGKPPHLHYSIATLIPYPWRYDSSVQGWKKIWYLNPISFFD